MLAGRLQRRHVLLIAVPVWGAAMLLGGAAGPHSYLLGTQSADRRRRGRVSPL